MKLRAAWHIAALLGAGLADPARAAEPAATPYRPSVSNPADLSAPGHFELEAGWQKAGGDGSRSGFPWLLKHAFTENFGILLGGEAAVLQREATGQRRRGYGDSSLALKFRRPLAGTSALGLEVGVKLATAADGLGSGDHDYSINGIYSDDYGPLRGDLNLTYTRMGTAATDESRHQLAWAAGFSKALGERWGATAELSGATRRGTRASTQFLAAASYNVSPTLVLDAGAATPLAGNAPGWTAFLGFTWLLR